MTKKTRGILLLVCAVLFLVIAPFIVLYSMGYRMDFERMKIVATGGIYVRVAPEDSHVSIDSKIKNKAGIFSNYVFEQSLLPGPHTIEIKKDGYFDYLKNLEVKEKEVVKLENVTLFKQRAIFGQITDGANYFSAAPDNTTLLVSKTSGIELINMQNGQQQMVAKSVGMEGITKTLWSDDSKKALILTNKGYTLLDLTLTPKLTANPLPAGISHVSFNPQNSSEIFFIKGGNLYSNASALPVISHVVAYQKTNQNIIFLSDDGFLSNYDTNSKITSNISSKPTAIDSGTHDIKITSGKITLKKNESLFIVNADSHIFENIYGPVKDFKVSPDGQKLLYYNDHELLLSFWGNTAQKTLLNRFSEQIKDAYWINNDYAMFLLGEKIIISEIDTRGNINMATLPPDIILIDGQTITLQTPQIFFNPRDEKLYIATQGNIVTSEKLIP